jgi:hypothetical protein
MSLFIQFPRRSTYLKKYLILNFICPQGSRYSTRGYESEVKDTHPCMYCKKELLLALLETVGKKVIVVYGNFVTSQILY